MYVRSRRQKATINCQNRKASCFACRHQASSVWRDLEGKDLSHLDATKTCNIYKAGQSIFYQGNPCLGLFCIESGTVALRKLDNHGNEMLVRLVFSGEVLGYRTFFAKGSYSNSAQALTDCRVCFIDQPTLKLLMDRDASISRHFLHDMAETLRHAEETQLQAMALPARSRLAKLLLDLKESFSEVREDGSLLIKLPLSRQDIASMLSLRPETLSRLIRSMEKSQIAIFKKREVLIHDLDALFDEIGDWAV